MINRLSVNIYRGLYNKFHGFKIAFMTHKKNLKKKKKNTKTQKKRRKIHSYNSFDGRFDKDFYYGFHKHQIA